MVRIPTIIRTIPTIMVKILGFVFDAIVLPTFPPINAPKVKGMARLKITLPLAMCIIDPDVDDTTIDNMLTATAVCICALSTDTSIGISIAPPPIPVNPAMNPAIIKTSGAIRGLDSLLF